MNHVLASRVTGMQDALRAAGAQAQHIGDLWNGTLALCTFVFVAIVVATIIAVWCAPRADVATRPDTSSLEAPEHRIWRRIGWATGLSVAGLLALLAGDVFTSRALARLPLRDAVDIELVGHQWWWEARYRDADPSREFTTANELTIPVGRPVLVTLRADDVIHSLWVPSLGGKKDLIPGRTATLRLRADRAGTYRGQCAEFCGLEHALMALLVHAVTPADYEAWAANQRRPAREPADAAARRGRDVLLGASCARCHAVAGTAAQGRMAPDLTHLASRQTIGAGMFPNNRGHLAGWIADPQALKPGVDMPANRLPPDDLQALLAYLETLR
jgi:cytochrome c oxidase subunit 2